MTLRQRLDEDLKTAMKQRKETTVSTLRMLLAGIQNTAIQKKVPSLSDEEILGVLKKQVKQHQDSIQQFTAGNRPDLAEKERTEMAILTAYLPAEMTDDELRAVIARVIAQEGPFTEKDFGRLMKTVMAQTAGGVDGKRVSAMAKDALTGKP